MCYSKKKKAGKTSCIATWIKLQHLSLCQRRCFLEVCVKCVDTFFCLILPMDFLCVDICSLILTELKKLDKSVFHTFISLTFTTIHKTSSIIYIFFLIISNNWLWLTLTHFIHSFIFNRNSTNQAAFPSGFNSANKISLQVLRILQVMCTDIIWIGVIVK